jgi:hypothetical protein
MGIGCLVGIIVPAALLAFQYRPPFSMLTLIVGAAVALAAGSLAMASTTRRRVTARLLLTSAAGALVLWTAYLFAWNLTTVRSPVTDSRDRYQLGFHMAPWTFTDEALRKINGLSIEVNEPFDVMLAFAAYDDGKIPTVWTPWSVIAAGTLLIATFGLGCGLWAVFCTAVAGRLIDSVTTTPVLTTERPAPPALKSTQVR